uniref:NADH dehydrogenase subunit 6 n=1 Tax=Proasellus granadensis TaxID=1281974 RepID=A0A485M7U9_9CRUS|nr:NADH dehydrogenase subunit 6 [Proasellus granadensis]
MNLTLIFLTLVGGLFLASNTPHMLIISLLTSTLLIVILLGFLESFPWLSYILFLIFLGGILILFTYISSLSSNLLFGKIKLELMVSFVMLTLMLSALDSAPHNPSGWMSFKYDSGMLMSELFAPVFYFLYHYLFGYLLITLLYVVMIMKVYYAPLRSAV